MLIFEIESRQSIHQVTMSFKFTKSGKNAIIIRKFKDLYARRKQKRKTKCI